MEEDREFETASAAIQNQQESKDIHVV